ncbi:MAG: hypothetical protein AB7Q17_06625 [Phycisphaerae bacterium]
MTHPAHDPDPHADPRPPRAIVALVSDLVFGSKLTATAAHLQLPITVARSVAALRAVLPDATAVLLDANHPEIDAPALVRELKTGHTAAPVIVFLSHVQVELAAALRAAGADEVLARSKFTRDLPAILRLHSPPRGKTSAE